MMGDILPRERVNKQICVRVSAWQNQRLRDLCERYHTTVTGIIRQAIDQCGVSWRLTDNSDAIHRGLCNAAPYIARRGRE